MKDPEQLYGVLGWPLGQSLSPLMHNASFRHYGMAASYMAWPVQPDRLGQFIEAMPLFKVTGCSVTIPHKIAVMPFLDNITEEATMAGAANTLCYRNGELCGDNTDVTGFLAPLRGSQLDHMRVLLLGAGGAARAVASALRLRGCHQVWIASPGGKRQYELAERFNFQAVPWADRYSHAADLVINATPIGMHGKLVAETPYEFERCTGGGIAYDLVYNPLKTRFLCEAAAAGWQTISGLAMFLGQGNAQFLLWTGREMPECARQLVAEALK